MHPRKQPQP
jgi:hypothetical protein